VPSNTGRYRTWAYSRGLRQAGSWRVVVRDAHTGRELARKSIEILDSETPNARAEVASDWMVDGDPKGMI